MIASSALSRITLRRGTVAALIRKDMKALWPFALALALSLVVIQAFFRTPDDYPNILFDFGRSQFHFAPVFFLFHAFGLPVVAAIFIVLLVHQDPAADARSDWMVRPISAADVVAAKVLIILAVVLIPSAIGNLFYVATHDDIPIDALTGPIALTLIGCIFMLVVAWLASSPVQALLAPLVLAIATLIIVLSLGATVGMSVVSGMSVVRSPVAREASAAVDRFAPVPAPVLRVVALKRERLDVSSADGIKMISQYLEPGVRYTPLIGYGWTVSTPDGAAFEWRLGDQVIGPLGAPGPVDAKSVDTVINAARSIAAPPPVAPPAPPVPEAPTPPPADAAAALDSDQPAVEAPETTTTTAQGRRQAAQAATSQDVRRPATFVTRRQPPVIDLTWPLVIGQFLLMLGAAGVVLWQLLVQRKLFTARMTFLGFFGAAVLLMLLQGAISTPRDEMIALERVASIRTSAPEPERMAAFAANDRNGDQKLDRAEYAAVLQELGFFDQFESLWMQRDDNMDGFITAQEYRPAIPGAPGGPPAPDAQRFAAFTLRDTNADRRLDPAEYQAALRDLGFGNQFDTLWKQRDGNEDGFVSAEEYGMPAQ